VEEQALLRRYGPELVKIAADFARPLSILPSPPLHHAKAERQRILNAAADFLLELSQRIPYVLYFNDLQWAAAGTIDTLFTLASRMSASAGHRLAILGSYRNDEVDGRPLSGLLERLTATGQEQTISLAPISEEQTGSLAESMLALPLPASLVAQIHQESGGLPFLIEETVRGLLESGGILVQDDGIKLTGPVSGLPLGVDVKSAILRRVNRLSRSSRRTLYALAVCGRPVEPAVLAASLGDTMAAVQKDLQGLFEKHLLMPVAGATAKYHLAHDRIRETLSAALPPRLRGRLHRSLARAYVSRLSPQESGEPLFVAVGHYSSGPEPKDPREREVTIDLNLRAARSAAQAAAFAPALRYLRAARGLLPKDRWQTQRERALAVEQQLAESAYAVGDLDTAVQAARSVIDHAADLTQEAKGWEIWMLCAFARGDHDQALDAGIDLVNRLGPQLPKHPATLDVLMALMRFKWDLHKLDLDAFIRQPETTDARVTQLLRVYSLMGAEAYLARPKLLPILNFELGRQSFRGGHGPPGAAALMSPAVCFSVLGDYATAAQLAEAGAKLLFRTHKDFQGKALLQLNMFVRPWREPLRQAAAGLIEGQHASLEAGDLEYAGFARSAYNVYAFYCGQPLAQLLAELDADARTVENSGSLVRTWSQMFKQMVHGLQHGVSDPFLFQGPHFQQTAGLPPPALSILSGWQYLLAGFYRIAATHQTTESEYLSSYLDSWAGSANPVPVFAYACLSWLQACRQSTSWWQRQRRWLVVSKALAKLRQWARAAPFNHAHRPTLIEAERLRTQQKLAQAIPLYERSIAQAEAGGFRHDVALSQELLAEVHIELGQAEAARQPLRQAHRLYAEWGAAGKAADLQARYSRFL
jgi:predicted ATPase